VCAIEQISRRRAIHHDTLRQVATNIRTGLIAALAIVDNQPVWQQAMAGIPC
jgi:hypothetical protein